MSDTSCTQFVISLDTNLVVFIISDSRASFVVVENRWEIKIILFKDFTRLISKFSTKFVFLGRSENKDGHYGLWLA